jgi:hypothetical protein
MNAQRGVAIARRRSFEAELVPPVPLRLEAGLVS